MIFLVFIWGKHEAPFYMYYYPPFKKDNKEVKEGINTGLAATIMLAVISNILAIFLMTVISVIAAAFIFRQDILSGGATQKLNEALNYIVSTENVYGLIFNMLLYLFSMFLPFLLISIYRKYRVKELMSFKRPKPAHLAYGIFITLGLSIVAQIIVSIILNILAELGISPDFPDISMNPSSPAATGLYFFFISVMPAFFEEFAMRGVVLGAVKSYSKYFALFFSALMFSLMHGTLQQIPYAFILGLSIGYFVIKFDSIWIGIAIHFANNFIGCVFELLSYYYNETVINTLNSMLSGILLVLGVLFLIVYSTKHSFALETKEDTHSFKECVSVLFHRPMFYIAIAIFAFMTVLNGYLV